MSEQVPPPPHGAPEDRMEAFRRDVVEPMVRAIETQVLAGIEVRLDDLPPPMDGTATEVARAERILKTEAVRAYNSAMCKLFGVTYPERPVQFGVVPTETPRAPRRPKPAAESFRGIALGGLTR